MAAKDAIDVLTLAMVTLPRRETVRDASFGHPFTRRDSFPQTKGKNGRSPAAWRSATALVELARCP